MTISNLTDLKLTEGGKKTYLKIQTSAKSGDK